MFELLPLFYFSEQDLKTGEHKLNAAQCSADAALRSAVDVPTDIKSVSLCDDNNSSERDGKRITAHLRSYTN
ncbi:hypothetical protein RB195_010079 [Necator americanus]|uniref:Uncharacterized protein n=1 Tax=Necator americanus TaxID=51031 RepID=A0ABR1CWA7_NECAM